MDSARKTQNGVGVTKLALPELPLEAWHDTKTTLHLYAQVIGKVRLALHPKLNHWWHAPLYVSPRGLTTQAIPAGDGLIDLEFDFTDHLLRIRSSDGRQKVLSLYDGLSVGAFYRSVMESLAQLGVKADILAKPYDPPRVGSDILFTEDDLHARYDAPYVTRFWQMLVWVHTVFTEFKGRFVGKSTPVHLSGTHLTSPTRAFRAGPRPVRVNLRSNVRRTRTSLSALAFGPGMTTFRPPPFTATPIRNRTACNTPRSSPRGHAGRVQAAVTRRCSITTKCGGRQIPGRRC